MSISMQFENTEAFANELDAKDPLRAFRDEFLIPKAPNGETSLYFVGNSLGLQPKKVRQYVEEELSDWADLGVKGALTRQTPLASRSRVSHRAVGPPSGGEADRGSGDELAHRESSSHAGLFLSTDEWAI